MRADRESQESAKRCAEQIFVNLSTIELPEIAAVVNLFHIVEIP